MESVFLADRANTDVISVMTNIISLYPDRCGCQGDEVCWRAEDCTLFAEWL